MAPTGRPRGRPRKEVDSIVNSAASSRPSSARRSTRNQIDLPSSIPNSSAVGDNDSDFLQLSVSKTRSTEKAKNASTRDSLSSVSTIDNNESSSYSTPATSAFTTPAPQVSANKPKNSRRGRRSAAMTIEDDIAPAVSLAERTAFLRNSQYSLNRPTNLKRKIADSEGDEDEELDADEDNSRDAQLARALQAEEDKLANTMHDPLPVRRTTRKVQKLASKSRFFADSDDEMADFSSSKPKVELASSVSNAVAFSSKKKVTRKSQVPDSDDTDDFIEIDASDEDLIESEDEDLIIARTPPQKVSSLSKAVKADKFSPRRKAMPPPQAPKNRKGSTLKRENTNASAASSALTSLPTDSEFDDGDGEILSDATDFSDSSESEADGADALAGNSANSRSWRRRASRRAGRSHLSREERDRQKLIKHHPEILTMWQDVENLPTVKGATIEQPKNISRKLKPFQLEGVGWMKAMEQTEWAGGLLGDEMGMGKTIQAVSLIMSDFPARQPSLVLIPPVALMQWQQEIADYTDGTLKTLVYHGTNKLVKKATVKELMKYNVILMSYNSLESMYRKQEKGFKRGDEVHKEKSLIHQIRFHRVILDEAHSIKTRQTNSAKACFALKADHKWCLSGTPVQNRIGELFSLVRFLEIRPFAGYFCKQCPCSTLEYERDSDHKCNGCKHSMMQHVSVFNQELLNPIQKYGNEGPGKEAFRKLRILTDRFMLRRVKRDQSRAMELPAKEIYVDRQFFGEEENDFASSIMNNSNRQFNTYVAQGVLLNNYANIFGLIMQMRQVADHPDLILKKKAEGGQNVLVCGICDEVAEEAIRSACKHDFCRDCVKNYLNSDGLRASDNNLQVPDCPTCHIPLAIDLEQPEIEQDEQVTKKSSIINRIKMENWTSSSKIELLVHELHELRSKNMSTKSIIFSQFTTMLQLVEWRLRRAGITTVMLDGSMNPAQRQASINHFMKNVDVECFLVSLKAGGVALNLTEASKVFIVDPWWNPASEWQSADRCHRIGQARPVSITRLCIEDSVESRMVLLQEKKANMINSTVNNDEAAMKSLTTDDMQFLFRGN